MLLLLQQEKQDILLSASVCYCVFYPMSSSAGGREQALQIFHPLTGELTLHSSLQTTLSTWFSLISDRDCFITLEIFFNPDEAFVR